jgi:casein kinase II subunit beta
VRDFFVSFFLMTITPTDYYAGAGIGGSSARGRAYNTASTYAGPAGGLSSIQGGTSRINEDVTDLSDNEDNISQIYSPWVEWFLSQSSHDFFVEIDEEYILDRFNLTGLTSNPHFQQALDRITKRRSDDEDHDIQQTNMSMAYSNSIADSDRYANHSSYNHPTESEIQEAAIELYGMVHARYIITPTGLAKMFEKFRSGVFGKCPRVYCRSFSLVPLGLTDLPRRSSVLLYCIHCEDAYHPRSNRYSNIDGAYFGTSFPHLFFQTFKQVLPKKSTDHYVPRIFGFRLYTGPKENSSNIQEETSHSMTICMEEDSGDKKNQFPN